MQIGFATYLTESYLPGYEALLYSLQKNNEWFNNDFVVLHQPGFTGKERCLKAYKNTKFLEVEEEKYKHLDVSNAPAGFARCARKIDLYRIDQYDRLIMIDVDMICVRDISNVFKIKGKILAGWRPKGHYNIGFVLIDKKYLGTHIRDDILSKCPKGSRQLDQDMFNSYFKGKITRLPDQYNVKHYKHYCKKYGKNKVKIIHFQHNNPWHESRRKVWHKSPWKIWWRYYNEYTHNNVR